MKALVLAGGSGTRFWPASRRLRPKQLLGLDGGRSFLRRTVDRLLPIVDPADVWVCTARDLVEQVREQLPEIDASRILAEPVGRNTGPAIAWTLWSQEPEAADEVMVSLHSDHWIEDEEAFRRDLTTAVEGAREHDLVMALGVKPRWAETGYGYMELGREIDAARRILAVDEFLEKPDAERAARLFAGGGHVWNSGVFVFPIATLRSHLERLQPDLAEKLDALREDPGALDAIYPELPAVPIDTAVMERIEGMATLVLDCGWSDVGSWESLAGVLSRSEAGNAVVGDVVEIDARDNVIYAEEGTVAVLGVEGLAVVRTADAVLVVPKARSQEVRRVVEELRRRGRDDLL